MKIDKIIHNCIPFITDSWKKSYGDFLVIEHIETFSKKMELYIDKGLPPEYSLPRFSEEVTPSLSKAIRYFEEVIAITKKDERLDDGEEVSNLWATTIENTPFEYILILMGQRCTPASITNQEAIPPIKQVLFESCFTPINKQIMIATRAWEKHTGRSDDNFWGEIKGSSKQKEEKVKRLIVDMIENQTWWNTFYHYKHDLVYEIRVSSGHGIRWASDGKKLIGFLEPFL